MRQISRDELWSRLSEDGLVSGDIPTATESQSPWPVRAMLGIAGWVGALFLLGFAGSAFSFIFDSAAVALTVGAICCLAAYGIFHALPRNDFAAQFGLALSLAGQALLLVGFVLSNDSGDGSRLTVLFRRPSIFFLMAVVEATLAFAVPNYIHRVLTTLAANICLSCAAAILGVSPVADVFTAVGTALIWLNPIRLAERPALWEPLGYGFAWALFNKVETSKIPPEFWRFLSGQDSPAQYFPPWASAAPVGLVFLYVAWELRKRAGIEPASASGILTVAGSIVFALCGLAAPGISAAMLVLALGFANGSRVLMGLGLLACGGYLSRFYYDLSFTLLVKSMVLAATGTALLGLRWAITRFLPAEETTHA